MKVGIVSMQRVVNYGSFLQAYSLKRIIEERGHICSFLDIEDENGSFEYFVPYSDPMFKLKDTIWKLQRLPVEKRMYREREYLFRKQLIKQLNMPVTPVFDQTCDIYIYGSDEIFNICQESKWGHSLALLGSNVNGRKITYAASFGFTNQPRLEKMGLYEKVRNAIEQFEAISVRDENSQELVYEMTRKMPTKNVDPVFLYDYDERKKYRNPFSRYVVVYGYDNRINDPKVIREVKRFAKERDLKTIGLGMRQNWCDINYLPHPFELLRIIEDADFIVTDTFHGTVFSIKYQRQFATIIRDSNQQKLTDLLNMYSLDSRIVKKPEDIEKILIKQYDKMAVQDRISKEKKYANNYISAFI